MEALRNVVQHRSIEAIGLLYQFDTEHPSDGSDHDRGTVAMSATRRVVVRVIPHLRVSDLRESQLKATVLKEIEGQGENVELTWRVREYVDGLAAVHYEFRARASADRQEWETTIRTAVTQGSEKWPRKGSNAVSLVAIEPSNNVIESGLIALAPVEYLNTLEQKNKGPLILSRSYVCGR